MQEGARETTRAPFLTRAALARATARALSSPRATRWGAVALVLVGLVGLAADALNLFAVYRADGDPYAYYAERPLAELFFVLQWVAGWFLISLGLVGLYALLDGAGKLPRRLALVGAALALATAALFSQQFLSFWLVPARYSPVPAVVFFGLPMGIVLSGVAAVWARGLGRWRFLPPLVCVLSTPLVSEILPHFLVYPDDSSLVVPTVDLGTEALLAAPRVAADVGWILFGLVLFGAKGRGDALLARERREEEERNLATARRLYEGAWARGDLSVVDDLIAPDFLDRRRSRRGPQDFKRAIGDLRRAFPDLRFEVEDQNAEGDTVTTRWSARGTDKGGVLWYPPTGRRAAFSGTYVDRFSDGKLVEHRGESDQAGLLEQLGLPTER